MYQIRAQVADMCSYPWQTLQEEKNTVPKSLYIPGVVELLVTFFHFSKLSGLRTLLKLSPEHMIQLSSGEQLLGGIDETGVPGGGIKERNFISSTPTAH